MRKVMVLSQETWNMMKSKITNKAMTSKNPVEVLNIFGDMIIEIDNDLPRDYVELYEENVYNQIKNRELDIDEGEL